MHTIKRGDSAPILEIFIRDTASDDLVGLTGKTYSDFTAQYLRNGAASATTITLASGSAGDAYSSGKLAEVSDGYYQIHLPTAMVADGVDRVNLILTVTGGLTINIPILLVAADTYNLIDGTTKPATEGADGDTLETLSAQIDTAQSSLTTLTNRITSTLFSGITSLANWLRLLARSDAAITADAATELGEINNDEGSGAGDYAATTDSHEAIRDRGDAEWVTGAGGGDATLANQQTLLDRTASGVNVQINSAVSGPTEINITRGMAYLASISNALSIDVTNAGFSSAMTGDGTTVKLYLKKRESSDSAVSITGSVDSVDSTTATLKFDLSAAVSGDLEVGDNRYRADVVVDLTGDAEKRVIQPNINVNVEANIATS